MGGIHLRSILCSVIPSDLSGLSAHGRSKMDGESYFLPCSGLVLSSESPHSCGLLECWGTDAPPQKAFYRQQACQTSAVFLIACPAHALQYHLESGPPSSNCLGYTGPQKHLAFCLSPRREPTGHQHPHLSPSHLPLPPWFPCPSPLSFSRLSSPPLWASLSPWLFPLLLDCMLQSSN